MDVGGDAFSPVQLILEQNDGEQPEKLNFSDVLETIHADPVYGGDDVGMARQLRAPSVEIVEQPASKALRFRYPCEGRSAGSLPGVHNTPENKTFPTIRINNYVGKCSVVVSLVTKDEPYRPHPHKLVGRERCEHGVCTVRADISEEIPTVQFRHLGIQCVKKKDIEASLRQREDLRVDPFRTGFDPRTYASIELNSLRLAFHVFLPDASGKMRHPLPAVCSDVIYDKKAAGDLVIVRLSHCSGSAKGGTQMVLLTEKVSREDLIVMFFDRSGWEACATIQAVHKLYAIVIDTPPYRYPDTAHHVNVEIRLQRGLHPADDEISKSFPFEYTPHEDQSASKKRKTLMQELITNDRERTSFQADQKIKIEPTPSPHQMTSPHQHMYSPVSPYNQQQWMEQAGSLNSFLGDMPWQFPQHQYAPQPPAARMQASPSHLQASPSHLQASPSHLQASPSHLQASPSHLQGQPLPMMHSPGHNMGQSSVQMGQVSPLLGGQMGQVSPMLGGQLGLVSPGMRETLSPGHGASMGNVSPGLQGTMSPGLGGPMGHISPGLQGTLSPGHGGPMASASLRLQHAPMANISPGLHHQQQTYQQPGMVEPVAMDTGTPSISGLLHVDPSLPQQLGEIFNISSLASIGDDQLSDGLKQLSTSDLQF